MIETAQGPANSESDFSAIQSRYVLPDGAALKLHDDGFIVVEGLVPSGEIPPLAAAYDAAVACADSVDVGVGRSTTRVHDFVNRGPDFDSLWIDEPILAACCSVIDRPFKLSTMHARTLRANSPAQGLHVDFPRDGEGWPMVGFIIMVDGFLPENGATCFVPGSHSWPRVPNDLVQGETVNYPGQVPACGTAGSVIIYNGSVWHGHGANCTARPRRSIQGAYIRRDAKSGFNLAARMRPETLRRISPLAKYLLTLPDDS